MQKDSADFIEIERLGGLAGFGGATGRIRSIGRIDLAKLSAAHRKAVEALLDGSSAKVAGAAPHPDGFRYRLRRVTASAQPSPPAANGPHAGVEVPESVVPDFVRDAVQDELS